MAQKAIEKIFKELGKKYDLPPYVIEEVYNSQFKKLKLEINSLEFPIIKLPNWGKYIPSQTKLAKNDYESIRQLRKQKEDERRNQTKDNQSTSIPGTGRGDI